MASSFDKTGGGSRKWWIIGGGCVLLFVCACVVAIAAVAFVPDNTIVQLRQLVGLGESSSVAAEFVPTSAPMFMVANPSFAQAANAKRVMDILSKNPFIKQRLDDMSTKGTAAGTDFSFERDVAPWIGTEVSFALLDAPASGSNASASPVPAFVVMAPTRDRAKSDEAMKRLRTSAESKGTTFTDEQYKGTTITTGTPQGGASASNSVASFATFQNMVIVGNSADAVKKAIDTKQTGGPASIQTTANYKAIVAKLPKDRAMTIVGDLGSLVKAAEASSTTSAAATQGLDALVGVGVSLGFTEDGIRVDTVVTYDPAKFNDATRALMAASQANPGKVLDTLPATCIAVVSGQNLKSAWDYYMAALSQDPQSKKQIDQGLADIKAQTGIDVAADVISWMTGEFAIDVVPAKPLKALGTTAPAAGLILAFEAKDAATVQAKLDKIVQALAKQGLMFAPKKVSGADMQELKGMEAQGITAGYGLVNGFVVIGSADDVLTIAVDGSKEPISKDAEYKINTKAFPQPQAGSVYFSLPRVVDITKTLLSGASLKDFQTNVEPGLTPFKSLSIGSGVVTDNSQTNVIFIHVSE